jgi:pyruvate dehydrogenase complex dehydrogenase (E1) component
VLATLSALLQDKQIEATVVERAIQELKIDSEKPNPAIS